MDAYESIQLSSSFQLFESRTVLLHLSSNIDLADLLGWGRLMLLLQVYPLAPHQLG